MVRAKVSGAASRRVNPILILAMFFCSSSFAGVITTSYMPADHSRVEITGTPSTIWTASFDFVSHLVGDFTTSPLLNEEFAIASNTLQKGLTYVADLKSELVGQILDAATR